MLSPLLLGLRLLSGGIANISSLNEDGGQKPTNRNLICGLAIGNNKIIPLGDGRRNEFFMISIIILPNNLIP